MRQPQKRMVSSRPLVVDAFLDWVKINRSAITLAGYLYRLPAPHKGLQSSLKEI
ncbi:MAG: hypothetical protein KDB01_21915 [Planctomycetaceae bacterium]|nr:hypothetical protein [Planctomycetaceae bacterium]